MITNLPERMQERIFPTEDGCWLWAGSTNKAGYSKTWFRGKKDYGHRVVYTLLVGEIPEGLVIDHLCAVTSCVNPDHLEAVTQAENLSRGPGNGFRELTHCKNGHSLEGCYVSKKGSRVCRPCQLARQRAHYQGVSIKGSTLDESSFRRYRESLL